MDLTQPRMRDIAWTCIANTCNDRCYVQPDWDTALRTMREHADTVPHDARWPLTFRTTRGVHYESVGLTT